MRIRLIGCSSCCLFSSFFLFSIFLKQHTINYVVIWKVLKTLFENPCLCHKVIYITLDTVFKKKMRQRLGNCLFACLNDFKRHMESYYNLGKSTDNGNLLCVCESL